MHTDAAAKAGSTGELSPYPVARPLRVGLLVDSLVQPRWVREIVEAIQKSCYASVALIIQNGAPEQVERGFVRRLLKNRRRIAYALYTRLDERLFRRQPDAFTPESIVPLIEGVPVLQVTPIKKKFSDYFTPEDVQRVREHDLDVVLRFGFRILRGDSLKIARHGVWSYHHGDNLVNRGSPPGFWEVMLGEPATGTVLQVLTDELDNGRVIYRSHAPTDTRSVHRNKDNFYRKAAAFVPRKLKELAEEGPQALDCDPFAASFIPYPRPLYREPGNLEMVGYGLRLAGRYAADKARDRVYRDQWAVAYRLHPGSNGPDPSFNRFKLLLPPKDRFWADPFPVTRGDRHFVFVEELMFRTNKGHIAVLELDGHGTLKRTGIVLDKPYHLSYPFMFEWRGEQFMIPETGDNRTIEVYRARAFPDEWTLEHVLMEGIFAVDATLLEHEGAWWMFATVAPEGVVNTDELCVYKSASPFGPWRPHRGNPVKSDARCARPAGRFFRWGRSLYRPSQDCSGRYGAATVINRVDALNDREYRETAVARIEPRWAPRLLGTHTLNSAPGITVSDALVRRRRFG